MNISYDSKSFIIGGKRVWLNMGEMHYYRFPAAEWRRTMRMAKAAGINTVSTYLAWNYHEQTEGVFDFEGDKDIGRFVDIAKEEGMYVFLRPGPYVCAEWAGGGLPPYLLNYDDMEIRTDNEIFMKAAERWYDKVFEIMRPRLITNGGNIIAVQNDNEYPGGWDEKGVAYIKKVYGLLMKQGIDVPITACNVHYKNGTMSINYGLDYNPEAYRDIILTYNTAGEPSVIPRLREVQPDKPVMVTELWTGSQVYWGRPAAPGMEQHVNICRFAAMQAQVNLYMFAGGTNFAYWGGNNIATSYASTYPVGEGGELCGQYYNLKITGSYMSTFGDYIASCSYEELCERELYIQKGEEGCMVYVASDKAEYEYEAGGRKYIAKPGKKGYGMYPLNFKAGGAVIDYSDVSVYARGCGAYFFTGNAGETAHISINGREHEIFVKYREPQVLEAGGITIVVCDEYLAKRTWFTKSGALIGYDMAYDTESGVYTENKTAITATVIKDGRAEIKKIGAPAAPAEPPALKNWEAGEAARGLKFEKISAPVPHNRLGVPHGYVWYKAKAHSETGGWSQMLISAFLNRIFVYVNGRFYGIFGENRNSFNRWDYANPTNAVREAIPVLLEKGENEVLFLSEDTGYNFDDEKPMGIMGDVFSDVRPVHVENPEFKGRTPITGQAYDYMYARYVRDMTELNTMEFDIRLEPGEEVFFVVHNKPCYIYINGSDAKPVKPVKKPWQLWPHISIWATYMSDCGRDNNRVRVQYYCSDEDILAALKVYVYKKNSRLTDWEFAKFPGDAASYGGKTYVNTVLPQSTLLVPGENSSAAATTLMPAYFKTELDMPEKEPVFLEIGKMKKGQIFLNGVNLGKINAAGPQKKYYLPRAYMKEKNTLVLFEEYGVPPQDVRLV